MEFYIDLGGTFCDVICKTPSGEKIMKLLSEDPSSYEDAPREAIRRILSEETGQEIGKNELIDTSLIKCIRMGTTVATNALLERKGEPIALLITKGFRDLLYIGNQDRPNIFDLKIKTPEVIYKEVVEIDERIILGRDDCELNFNDKQNCKIGLTGEKVIIETPLNENQLINQLKRIKDQQINSLAIALMHSYTYPEHEQRIKAIAIRLGFRHVTLSSELTSMAKIVKRGHTTCVDAYLTPHIHKYIHSFSSGFKLGLNKLNVLFMQSDGGLSPVSGFCGSRAILSGPAGGVVGFTETCKSEFKSSNERTTAIIGFDMGGTSTDIYRYNGSELEYSYEQMTDGIPIQCPQLDISTVASGGGSLLRLNHGLFLVGPESAGAYPGPVCYRNKSSDLTVTDANLCLGRVLPDYFPAIFGKNNNEKLDKETVCRVFEELALEINSNNLYYKRKENDKLMTTEEVALGFIKVANEAMCRPIRNITQGKGYDTSAHLLCAFGGASGQVACSVARNLGINRIFIHKYASILSAYGMSLANVENDCQESSSILFKEENFERIDERFDYLKSQSRKKLIDQGFTDEQIDYELYLNLRYDKTDYATMVKPCVNNKEAPYCSRSNFEKAFIDGYRREFGFTMHNQDVFVDDIRVRGIGKSNFINEIQNDNETLNSNGIPSPDSVTDVYFENVGYQKTAVFKTSQLKPGNLIEGPCIVIDDNSTILVEPGCTLEITKNGNMLIKITQQIKQTVSTDLDPIQLSIFSQRFMSIAEQMGRVLQRTAISTNIKERLDFSCALFDDEANLTSSAPHIPVHLGSMQEAVKSEVDYFNDNLKQGDVLLTNHPSAGGTHLPDLTVITPVFYRNCSRPVFYVASRGHHSDVGGLTPGSMPPNSNSLIEEGATFRNFKLIDQGVFQEEKVIEAFMEPAKIPGLSGCRTLKDNLRDLKAQIAANQKGLMLVNELIDYYGLDVVKAYMTYIQENAAKCVRDTLRNVVENSNQYIKSNNSVNRNSLYNKLNQEPNEKYLTLQASDFMDDGTEIKLAITIDKEDYSAKFDFSGTGMQVLGNCNAPRSVTYSAIIYALRCMVPHEIPLNQGCLKNIKIEIPKNCILDPSSEAAVVGGNVLTSQRIVDVIFKAFETCAASQGCMNNVTFGDQNSSYYETLGGGAGAGPNWHGRSGVHTHMTNTRITDPEILEKRYPVILKKFLINRNTGGKGKFNGGDGLIRELLFRKELVLSVLTERRVFAPYGLQGGEPAKKGRNILYKKDNRPINLGSKATYKVKPGDLFHIETPGGGGFGRLKN